MRNRFLGVVSILLLWVSCPARAELRASVARVDITPKTHEPMWGFEDRTDPATMEHLICLMRASWYSRLRGSVLLLSLSISAVPFGEPDWTT